MSAARRQSRKPLRTAAAVLVAGLVGPVALAVSPAAAATVTVSVDFAARTGPVHGGATGMLYGVSDDDVPTRAVVAGAAPRTVTQMPEGGLQHPNGGALTSSRTLFDAGTQDIYVNIQDQYPQWGYANAGVPSNTYPGQADYLAKVREVVQRTKDGAAPGTLDRYVFTPFNEPDWIWYGDWTNRKAQFFADWKAAHAEIRRIVPNARIAATGESQYNSGRLRDFLAFAKANGVLPDITTWHELDDVDLRDFPAHLADYRRIERELGISPRPVNITEYAGKHDTSVPGRMIQWISMLENAKVDGQLAYWGYAGNLNDHTAQANGANGGWWLLKWYRDLTGETVRLTPPQPNTPGTVQGLAAVDRSARQASVLVGGTADSVALNLTGLDRTVFGSSVDVRVERADWTGQEGFSTQPRTVKTQRSTLSSTGGATVNLPGGDPMDAYRVIVTPAGSAALTVDQPWQVSVEAEGAALSGGARAYGPHTGFVNAMSGARDVGSLGSPTAAVTFPVTVPRTGSYHLTVTYGTGGRLAGDDHNVLTGRHALYVDGALDQTIQYTSTLNHLYRGQVTVPVRLSAGTHHLSVRTSADGGATSLPGSDLSIDKFDLTEVAGVESARYPAVTARRSGSTTVLAGQGAYAGTVRLGTGGSTEFFLAAADDGYYDVTVDHATPSATELSTTLNGRTVRGLRSTGAGRWSSTATVHLARGVQQLRIGGIAGVEVEGVRVTRNPGADSSVRTIQAESSAVTRSAGVTVETPAAGYGSNVQGQYAGWITAGRTLTVARPAGTPRGDYNLLVRYGNAEKNTGHAYNTDVITRTAQVSEVGGAAAAVTGRFRHNYSYYNFWTRNVPLTLTTDTGALRFGNPSGNAPNVDAFQLAPLVRSVTTSAR